MGGTDLRPVFALTDLEGSRGLFNAFNGLGICFILAISAGKKRIGLTKGLTLLS
jgi:hypothetical protein